MECSWIGCNNVLKWNAKEQVTECSCSGGSRTASQWQSSDLGWCNKGAECSPGRINFRHILRSGWKKSLRMRIGCYSLFTFNYVLTLLVNTQCQHLLVLPIFCSSAYYQANSVDKSTPSFGFPLALRNYHLLSPMCNEAGKVAQIACRGQFG